MAKIREHVAKMLNRNNKSLKDVVSTLRIYHDNVSEKTSDADDAMEIDGGDQGRPSSQREILEGLIAYLESCES
jgi:beta-catenin-like protein 1